MFLSRAYIHWKCVALRFPGCGRSRTPDQTALQSLAVVTERMSARAATAIVALDVVAFGARVVVVVHPRTRLSRVIGRDFGHEEALSKSWLIRYGRAAAVRLGPGVSSPLLSGPPSTWRTSFPSGKRHANLSTGCCMSLGVRAAVSHRLIAAFAEGLLLRRARERLAATTSGR
jgi:hypothetical protein